MLLDKLNFCGEMNLMTIKITLEFGNAADAREALDKLFPLVVVSAPQLKDEVPPETPGPSADAKVRKPRADAGQTRGPYKPRAAVLPELPQALPQAQSPATPLAGPKAADVAAEKPTFDAVKAALDKLHEKRGMEACRTLLLKHGNGRASQIKPEDYAAVLAEIGAALK